MSAIEVPAGRPTENVVLFANDGAEWSAMRKAEAYITGCGWSVGPTDITGVRGVLFLPGVYIAKWKNLTPTERAQCDARLIGRGRTLDLELVFA